MPMPRLFALTLVSLTVSIAAPGAAQQISQDHPGYTQAEIDAGSRVYSTQCQQCHGPNGDQITGIDLRRRIFKRVNTDEDLATIVTSGVPTAGMPPFKLQPAELTGIVAFIRAGFDTSASVKIGDAARGKTIFDGKGNCASCHRVSGRGPRVAPELSDIGLARTPAALQRSILDPSSAMLPINRPVAIVMKDGNRVAGRRLNEDTATVQVIDSEERLRSLDKRDIRTMTVETRSPMPSYAKTLSQDEVADLVAYLLTLREL
jgi:putative heme-binding domain-containing protein